MKYIISVACLFISINILAQTKFVPGYTVSPARDTMRCFIKYEDWAVSPDKIEIKRTENKAIEIVPSRDILSFYLEREKQTYLSKKIGVLDINLNQEYKTAPSQEALDSTVVFLRLITSGPKATLLEYLNAEKIPHYFLQTPQGLKELINYPFYRGQGLEKYLLILEQYKWQLPLLLPKLKPGFQLPEYNEKALGKFINNYNEVHDPPKSRTNDPFELDISFAAGLKDNTGYNVKNKAIFGISIRVNMPRKFHNRYLKISYVIVPGVIRDPYATSDSNKKLQSVELGVGSYFGSSRFRPNIGFDLISPIRIFLNPSFGPHIGISYKRMLTLEMGHFANFFTVFTNEEPFLNKPRISLNYYLNLNRFFDKR